MTTTRVVTMTTTRVVTVTTTRVVTMATTRVVAMTTLLTCEELDRLDLFYLSTWSAN